MKLACVLIGMGMLGAIDAGAQVVIVKKKPDIFGTPRDSIAKKLGRREISDDEFNGYMWNFSRDTMEQDVRIRQYVVDSETTPFRSRRMVWADATMPWRAAEFGVGPLSSEAQQRPVLEDRDAAARNPELDYSAKPDDTAILAAAYRHFFDYRMEGFGKTSREENAKLKVNDVYFLGFGPHITDAPPSLLAALQNDPDIQRDKVKLRPLSKVLEVTAEAIRDRDTGAYGPAFRVDSIGQVENGEVKVLVTFTEREGFWFTRELTLRQGKTSWEVASDTDYALR
jgi:hypothetical protein